MHADRTGDDRPPSLTELPNDVLETLTAHLDLIDVVSLASTQRAARDGCSARLTEWCVLQSVVREIQTHFKKITLMERDGLIRHTARMSAPQPKRAAAKRIWVTESPRAQERLGGHATLQHYRTAQRTILLITVASVFQNLIT